MTHVIDSIVGIQPPFNMIVLVALIGMIITLFGGAAKQFRHWACHRQELELKRELVERGLSADEIVKVIEASGLDDSTPNWGEIMGDAKSDAGARTAPVNAAPSAC
jgi:hypothetical protein